MRMNTAATQREYRTRAKNNNVTIEYVDGLETPHAQLMPNGNYVIRLPRPNPLWGEDKWVQWEYSAEHELGHIVPECTDGYDLLREKKLNVQSFLGASLNVMEDNRQEYNKYYELDGRRKRLNVGRRAFLDSVPDNHLGQSGGELHRDAFEALYVWDTMMRSAWMPALNGKGESQLPLLTEQQVGWIDKLVHGDYASIMLSGYTAFEQYDLLLRIIDEVFEFTSSEQEEQDAQQQQQQQEGEGQEEGQEGGDKAEEGEDEAESGEGDKAEQGSGDGEDSTARTEAGTVNYSDLLAHQHDHDEDSDTKPYGSLKIIYDENSNVFETLDPEKYREINLCHEDIDIADGYGYRDNMARETAGAGLAKHVRRLLQVKSQSTYQHGLKRGKISPKSIYRGGLVGSASEKRVFKKKQDNDILDTAVFVLVDASGSMAVEKATSAGVSAKLLNEAISTIGVPLEIASFDASRMYVRHIIWKEFSTRVSGNVLLDRATDAFNSQMCSNSDGESILWAYSRLTKRKEKRKILVVLSDGSPACGRGDAQYFTKEVIKNIEGGKQVEIYGIGIEDDNVQYLYKDNVVIDDASQLERGLLTVIKSKILS